MFLVDFLRERISPQNPLLLFYHKLIAIAAAIFYRFPGNKIKIVAITGTKGKSTVSHFITSILMSAGHKVGLASTIRLQVGEASWPNTTKQTTQGRFRLQQLLRAMVNEKCDFAVLEVTSHALVQSRFWGINVDTAVLTNVQRDHIEYHGSFEKYMHAKGLLFANIGRHERKSGMDKCAVLPIDDAHFAYFDAFPVDRKISYGEKGMVHATDITLRADGSTFTLNIPNDKIKVDLKIPGEFNIMNALAAASAALSFGIKLTAIKKGLEAETDIPGRLEAVRAGQPFTVVVDYAHTPVSLEKILSLFRPLTKGKLFVVFGATGGGRDKSKRPEMGAVADRYADYIVVTDDDPYTENRMQIIDQVCSGIKRKEGQSLWKIRDRKQAIRLALSQACEGDCVIIAGKGCEPIQIVGKERIPWDDRRIVREILESTLEVQL